MFKKFMLVVASMAVIAVAYVIYQWQGEAVPVVAPPELAPLPRPALPTTMQADGARPPAIPIGPNWITAGDAPLLRIYDRQGNARIVFRATHWNPISDSEFDLLEATVRLTLPGGQLAYIWADEGRITVLQGKDNNPVAKRGRLQGNVRLFIDLTDESWREDHPAQADLDQHPESVVKLWLDHVRFDLDLSLLESDGPILLQSALGDIEGKGLKINWNERDRRIQQLTIAEGRRAVLRGSEGPGMSSLRSKESKAATASAADDASLKKPTEPVTPAAASAPAVARIMPPDKPGGLPYIELGNGRERAAPPRIETYRLVFREQVAAAQKENGRRVGDLTNADTLQLLVDFNQSQRRGMGRQASRPAGQTPATAPASAPAGGVIELTWTGPLEVIPVTDEAGASPAVNRMQLVIRGPAVQFHSRDGGSGEFPELEYHDEAQRIWLRGSKDKPVALEPSEGRQLVARGIVSADLTKRTARVDGPGRFTDRGQVGLAPVDPGRAETSDFRNVEIAWEGSVDLEFARDEHAAAASAPPTVNVSPIPQGAYIKRAVLLGQAVFADDRGSIRADKIDVVCGEPRKAGPSSDPTSSMVVERMTAVGHVMMTVANPDETVDTVECQHLEVDFGLTETGRSFPREARAVGFVVARRTGRAAKWGPRSVRDVVLREITAQDGLVLDMMSVAVSLSPEDIARKEAEARARARQQGIVEGSEQWKKHEERLRSSPPVRSRTIAHRLRASGKVAVLDLKQELDLAADSIDCELGRGREEIRTALIMGSVNRPARVVLGDFFIRGPRIDVDVESQSAEVPGAGTLRFMTRQDLDGRAVDKPIPVVVSWDKHMSLAGDRNSGRIVGKVRAVSETVTLDCDDEMQLEFEDVARPAAASRPARQEHHWIFGMLANVVTPSAGQTSDARAGRQLRKRLKLLDAVGNAVIEGKVRQEGTGRETAIEQWLNVWNESLERMLPTDIFQLPTRPADQPTRLASRVLVKGPRVVIRLDERQMMVEGGGHLLVEDYRLRKAPRGGRGSATGGSLLDSASMVSVESLGPSQTLFTWVNSMSFLNNRNTAIFDSGVEMRHLSGSKLIELDRVASAILVEPARLKAYPGREASLNCDRFTVEFERDAKTGAGEPAPLSRATRLKGFWALGRQVRLEESGRFVEGVEVSFDSASQVGRVIGSPEFPARMRYLDERTGRPIFSQVEQFQWDQRTGVIKVRDPQLISTGR